MVWGTEVVQLGYREHLSPFCKHIDQMELLHWQGGSRNGLHLCPGNTDDKFPCILLHQDNHLLSQLAHMDSSPI